MVRQGQPSLTEYEKRHCTKSTQNGLMLIRSLDDERLLDTARNNQDSEGYQFVARFMGPRSNPSWATAQAAEEAYLRGLIDEVEFDYLSR